jgi:hypothetical protein
MDDAPSRSTSMRSMPCVGSWFTFTACERPAVIGLIAMRRPLTRMSVAVAPRLRRLMLALSPRAPEEPRRVSFSGRFTTDGNDVSMSTGSNACRTVIAS